MFTVMLVDDEEMILRGLTRLIAWEDFGLEIIATAANGAQAWDAFCQRRCDILITDIRMPQMDGLALLSRVCKEDSRTKCIVISGYDEFDYIKQALRYGIENYILKPVDEEELSATLVSTVEKLERATNSERMQRYGADTLRSNVIERWTQGTMPWEEVRTRAALSGVPSDAPWYAVALVRMPRDDMALPPLPLDGLLFSAYASSMRPGLYTLLFSGHDAAAPDHAALTALLEGVLPPGTQLGLGDAVFTMEDVPASRRSAHQALVWSSLTSDGRPVTAWAQQGAAAVLPQAFLEARRALEADVRQGQDAAAIGAALDACFSALQGLPEAVRAAGLESLTLLLDENAVPLHAPAFFSAAPSMDEAMQALRAAFAAQAVSRSEALPPNPTVEAIYRYVDMHYQDDISLKKLGDALHFSPAYLGQLFKQYSSCLFLDYVSEYRIEKAKALLVTSTHRSGDIGRMVGFRNPNYFANVFRKITGMYPTVYRKTWGTPID